LQVLVKPAFQVLNKGGAVPLRSGGFGVCFVCIVEYLFALISEVCRKPIEGVYPQRTYSDPIRGSMLKPIESTGLSQNNKTTNENYMLLRLLENSPLGINIPKSGSP
jgi:hypothetical protein